MRPSGSEELGGVVRGLAVGGEWYGPAEKYDPGDLIMSVLDAPLPPLQ